MKKSLFAYVGAGCLALAGTIVAASSSGPLFSPTDADAVPYGLAATLSERGVALTWSSAIDRFNTTPVTESFENYEPLTDQMGP